MKCIL